MTMIKTGTILKINTDNEFVFYQVTSIYESTYGLKALCKVKKGFLTIKYKNSKESHIYKSSIGIHYLMASKKEVRKVSEILDNTKSKILEYDSME